MACKSSKLPRKRDVYDSRWVKRMREFVRGMCTVLSTLLSAERPGVKGASVECCSVTSANREQAGRVCVSIERKVCRL